MLTTASQFWLQFQPKKLSIRQKRVPSMTRVPSLKADTNLAMKTKTSNLSLKSSTSFQTCSNTTLSQRVVLNVGIRKLKPNRKKRNSKETGQKTGSVTEL